MADIRDAILRGLASNPGEYNPEATEIGIGVGPLMVRGLLSKAPGVFQEAGKAMYDLKYGDKNPEAVLAESGWWRAPDGKMRNEITDDLSYMKRPIEAGKQGPVSTFLSHDKLFENYPDLADMSVGGFNPGQANYKGAYFSGKAGSPELIAMEAAPEQTAHSVLLHELQHAIQHRESFGRGGNAQQVGTIFPAELADEIARLSPKADDISNGGWGTISTMAPEMVESTAKHNLYQRLSGEAEARNVQTRQAFSPAERAMKPFPSTLDIPYDQQLILNALGGKGPVW